jgi:hypothetical protein
MRPEQQVITEIAKSSGCELSLDGGVLMVGDAEFELPAKRPDWEMLNFRHAFPSRAHGDLREKLVYQIVQDSVPPADPPKKRELDADFRRDLPDNVDLPDPVARSVVAAAIADEYFTEAGRFRYLVPYHSLLPASFDHSTAPRGSATPDRAARYKLFASALLPFLCWTGDGVDTDLATQFLDVMNRKEDFILLDKLMYGAAAAMRGGEMAPATVTRLMASDLWTQIEPALTAGAFCQPALTQFQDDLRTVLSLRDALPRRDLLDLLTALLSLHLTIHYYRVAVALGEQIDYLIAVAGDLPEPAAPRGWEDGLGDCSLAGKMLFRVGTAGDRTIRMNDPCVGAYRELTDRRLLALPAAIITANYAHWLWSRLNGAGVNPDLPALTEAVRESADLKRDLNAGAAAFAVLYVSRTRAPSAPEPTVAQLRAVAEAQPGLFALRQAVTTTRRTRLRHLSRDVVHQLARRETGGHLIRTRGSYTFFELDEDFLFLLVKLICRRDYVDFTTFLDRLREYGLAPQDDAERELLIGALERLGMLRRYSDAGESIYVHHPIA